MAAPKKAVKSAEKAAETVKAETAAPKEEAGKSEAAVAPVTEGENDAAKAGVKKETAAKKETVPKAEKRGTAKKTVEKKETVKRTTTKKAEQKAVLHVQFSNKSYSQDDLVKIAQDVWKYDLKQKVRELASIELYVKPEEGKVYYVMNNEFTGSFDI